MNKNIQDTLPLCVTRSGTKKATFDFLSDKSERNTNAAF